MSEIKPSFTTPQVAQVVDIPWRKIVQFEERGLVSPSIQPASGRGSKRLWSYEDIIRCCVIRYLGSGLSSDYLRIVMEKFGSDKLIGPEMEAFVWFPVGFQRKKGGEIIFPRDEYLPDVMMPIDKNMEGYHLTRQQLSSIYPAHIMVNFERIHSVVRNRIKAFL